MSGTWVLIAGVVASLALLAYLGVAFATTHATAVSADTLASEVAPFVPYSSKLVPVPWGKRGGIAVRVSPIAVGNYGALVQTLVYQPPSNSKFVLSLWLRAARPGQVALFVDEPGLGGAKARYVVNTTLPVNQKWRRFAFRRQVVGNRLSIALAINQTIYRQREVSTSWFEVHDLKAVFP